MKKFHYFWHLAKRTWSSYRAQPLSEGEQDEVGDILLPAEQELWARFQVEDQRHSYIVMKRFQQLLPHATHPQLRAALLHDIGKINAPLSTTLRVIATFVGPRTASFRAYHDHEQLGLQLLDERSDPVTIQLLRDLYALCEGQGRVLEPAYADVVSALMTADNV